MNSTENVDNCIYSGKNCDFMDGYCHHSAFDLICAIDIIDMSLLVLLALSPTLISAVVSFLLNLVEFEN